MEEARDKQGIKMQRRSMSGLKHSLEENGFTLRTCEFKSQIDGIKVLHSFSTKGST